MYLADRVREPTTTTGTGTVTLAGAAVQCQRFQDRVQVGDPCEYVILDANGTGWEVGSGTLLTTTTLSRDTVEQSSNADALVSLSSGTHTVFLTFSADRANKTLVTGDVFIDHFISGLALPTTSGNLTGSISAGQAYVIGQRVVKGSQANTYTASKDTYVDLSNTGVWTYSAVANGAGAPAVAANSIRRGFVTTNGSVITGATSTGKDSLGNWLGNTVRTPFCRLFDGGTQTVASTATAVHSFGAGTEVYDNDAMHSTSVNNTRLTITRAGEYIVTGFCEYISLVQPSGCMVNLGGKLNGSLYASMQNAAFASVGGYPCLGFTDHLLLVAGDYLELQFSTGSVNTETATNFTFQATRVG